MRRRRLRSCALLPLLIMLVGAGAVSARPAEAATLPVTAMTVESSPGARLLSSGGFDMHGSTVSVSPSANAITFGYSSPDTGSWTVRLSAPTGGSLAVGTYPAARFADATHVGLDMTHEGSGCNASGGKLVVHGLTRELVTQDLTSFSASYWHTCDGGTAIKGELRWKSDVDYARFGSVQLGTTSAAKVLTVKAGPLPVTFGTAVLGGDRPDDFRVVGDTCRQKTVAAGASCTISVAAAVTHAGPQQATVTVPQTAPTGRRLITLVASGTTASWGTYSTVKPARVLDTRSGVGAAKKPLAAGSTTAVTMLGRGGIPATGVAAVVLNLTATRSTTYGYLAAWPTGVARPTASSLNYRTGVSQANLVTVAVGTGGKINVFNSAGKADVLADVVGYYRSASNPKAAGQYFPITPERRFDSRTDFGALAPGDGVQLAVSYHDPDGVSINNHLRAIAVNVTAVSPKRAGYLVAWDGTGDVPATSTLNFRSGAITANTAIVKVSPCVQCGDATGLPSIAVVNQSPGTVHLLVDVAGLYDDGTLGDGMNFQATTAPVRIVDTRIDRGTTTLGPRATRTVKAPASVVGDADYVLVTNTTIVRPSASTYLTMWDEGERPYVSNVSARADQTVANGANINLAPGNLFRIYNVAGTSDALIDVVGTMRYYSTVVESDGPDRRTAAAQPAGLTPAARPVVAVRR